MSPERKEPNATWQNANDQRWDDSDGELLPLSDEQDEEAAFIPKRSAFPEDENIEGGELAEPEPFYTNFEAFKQLGQQFSPILAPLLFGGLTFLFLLSLMRSNRFYLHAELLWPIGLVLLAIAILQGMMLYYAGSNNVYWSLGIVAGFFLFLLVGCFVLFGPFSTFILLAVMLVGGLIAARFSMHPVPEGCVDIVYAFGKYNRTLLPGLNFVLPWESVNTETRLSTRERQWTCPEQVVSISFDEELNFKATITYQLVPEDAYLAVTQVENWEGQLQEDFKVVLQYVTPQLTSDDFLLWARRSRSRPNPNARSHTPEVGEEGRWEHINIILFQHMRDRVASWGVEMKRVEIRDITLTPHASSRDTRPVFVGEAAQAQPPPQASSRRMGPDTSGRIESIEVPQPAPTPASHAAPPAKRPKEDVLITAYKQIKSGDITSPEAIRKIASGFLAYANDQNVSFDPVRAAEQLFDRARLLEEQQASLASQFSNEAQLSDETPVPPNWSYRPPTDDNLTLGG